MFPSHDPEVYYHVWDNYPYPTFNKVWYDSTDHIVTISKLTSDIVKTVAPNTKETYLPHAIPTDIFRKHDKNVVKKFRKENLQVDDDTFVIFWNNRNARRKQSGSLIYWYSDFIKKAKKKNKNFKSKLIMHTEPFDPNGQNLYSIIEDLNLTSNEVVISTQKVDLETLSVIYNASDVTMGISDAEGFGLATFESLACGTPY